MLKIKGLRPSHREKKRYLVYEIQSDKKINMHKAQVELIEKINTMMGVFMPAGILPIKYDTSKRRGIIRCNHTAVNYIRSCFVMINNIQHTQVSIHTVGVSGILKIAKAHIE